MIREDGQPGLPTPDAAALAHSAQLCAHIAAAIDAAGGTIPFSTFMQMALNEPGLGYYSAGAARFGPGGDFVTAVDEGDFLARAIVTTLRRRLASLDAAVVVELGAGTGRLAGDVLRLLDAHGLSNVGYRILEPSADLRGRQRHALQGWGERVTWIDRLERSSVRGCIVANEVADALPVDRVTLTDAGWRQLAVAHNGAKFYWTVAPLSAVQQRCLDSICAELPQALPAGFTSEIRPALGAWVRTLAAALDLGDMLIVDYGLSRREYFHPQRSQGTLICHYRHRAHADPFFLPGIQDISAWVDFSDCADAACRAGLQLAGYTTQGSWLAEALSDDATLQGGIDLQQAGQLRRLLLPGEMGERFKALLLSRAGADMQTTLPGRDLRSRL